MKWFLNLKMGAKIILSFLVIAIIAGTIGYVGIINIQTIDDADTKLYEKITVPLGQLEAIATAFLRQRVNIRDIFLHEGDIYKINDYENRIKERDNEVRANAAAYEKLLFSDEGKKLFNEFTSSYNSFYDNLKEMIFLIKQGKTDEAKVILNGKGYEIAQKNSKSYKRYGKEQNQFWGRNSERKYSIENQSCKYDDKFNNFRRGAFNCNWILYKQNNKSTY